MLILASPQEAQKTVLEWKANHKVAFVPTMGCLHEGHLRLVDEAKKHASKVVVSIFVNPLQFGPNEDFDRYPRAFEEDSRKCAERGVDLLFHPTVADFYPKNFNTRVTVTGSLPIHLCGKSRPGHFEGVTTVCAKLFHITQPDVVVFGQKDFQQSRLIAKMIEDLSLPIHMIAHPTVREADGLALSSRNRYLSNDERERAALLPKTMRSVAAWAKKNPSGKVGEAISQVKTALEGVSAVIDYVEVASEEDLIPVPGDILLSQIPRPRLFVAVKFGKTRLIDNLALENEGKA